MSNFQGARGLRCDTSGQGNLLFIHGATGGSVEGAVKRRRRLSQTVLGWQRGAFCQRTQVADLGLNNSFEISPAFGAEFRIVQRLQQRGKIATARRSHLAHVVEQRLRIGKAFRHQSDQRFRFEREILIEQRLNARPVGFEQQAFRRAGVLGLVKLFGVFESRLGIAVHQQLPNAGFQCHGVAGVGPGNGKGRRVRFEIILCHADTRDASSRGDFHYSHERLDVRAHAGQKLHKVVNLATVAVICERVGRRQPIGNRDANDRVSTWRAPVFSGMLG